MEMVAHHRITANLDAEAPGELAQPIENPPFAVTVVVPRVRVHAAEEGSSDASCYAVINTDLVFADDLVPGISRHRWETPLACRSAHERAMSTLTAIDKRIDSAGGVKYAMEELRRARGTSARNPEAEHGCLEAE